MSWKFRWTHAGVGAVVGAAMLVAAFVGSTSPALAAPEDPSATAISGLERLSTEEIALYESDDLKLIRIDASSGAVESVEPLTPGQLDETLHDADASSTVPTGLSGSARLGTGCSSGSPCWYGLGPVYDYSFTLGTTSGTWGNRGKFFTGDYYAKLCWLDPYAFPVGSVTYCMPERNGTNAVIDIGTTVTGKQVNLSTVR